VTFPDGNPTTPRFASYSDDTGPRKFWCDMAWVRGEVKTKVLIETAQGRISAVTCGVKPRPADAEHLAGFTVPGLANVHSHAFHRALRGRTQVEQGTFWTWRERMYAAAAHLDPDSYRDLATAVFAEMALAGITAVGEFHYLHHSPKGGLYQDPNAMGHALAEAASAAGIRITLLDTCYLSGGFDTELNDVQRRFSDGDAARWAERVEALRKAYAGAETVRIGTAVHSVRAVPVDQLAPIVGFAAEHELPLHVHLSEQRAENDACLARHHKTPTELLHAHGALGPRTTAVHATHLSQMDIDLLGTSATAVCMCPTTERDLADGIGPAHAAHEAGSPINLGSDSHAVIDLFEEARAVELDERLRTERRGHWRAEELLHAATDAGHAALGWPEAGQLAAGALADFTTIALDTVRLAGVQPAHAAESVVFAATAADVRHVVVAGRFTVRDHRHALVEDVPGRLSAAIGAIFK
jgi:formiminoglutamate deiminase